MKLRSFFFTTFIALFAQAAGAQTRPVVNASTTSLVMSDCAAGSTCTQTFTLINPQAQAITIEKVTTYAPVFSVSPATPFSIGANGSQTVTVSFSSTKNLTYKDIITVEPQSGVEITEVALQARAVYNEDYGTKTDYYLGTEDLWGEALKTKLKSIISNNTNNSYDTSRNAMFGTGVDAIDNGNGTKTLECIYTGRLVTMSKSTARPSASSPEYINTEHTWPQSKFNEQNPMVSDVHHLFPSDVDANGERSNFPFGIVNRTDASTRCHDKDVPSQNGTCANQGSGDWSYLQNSVYEPRDVQKGNTARAMFYFVTRYGDLGSFWSSSMESAFRTWHKNDPPDAKEKARNTGIMNFQNNRNPYVDHPEFIDRISLFGGTATGEPSIATPSVVPVSEGYGNVAPAQQLEAEIDVINRGNAAFTYTTSLSGTGFSIVSGASGTVSAYGVQAVRVRFSPAALTTYNGILTVTPSTGNAINVILSGMGSTSIPVETETLPTTFVVDGAYPNPFQTSGTLRFTLARDARVRFEMTDVLGRQVVAGWQDVVNAGTHERNISGESLPAGLYLYRFTVDGQTVSGKWVKAGR